MNSVNSNSRMFTTPPNSNEIINEIEDQFRTLAHNERLQLINIIQGQLDSSEPLSLNELPKSEMVKLVAELRGVSEDIIKKFIAELKELDEHLHNQKLIEEVASDLEVEHSSQKKLDAANNLHQLIFNLQQRLFELPHEKRLKLIHELGMAHRKVGKKTNQAEKIRQSTKAQSTLFEGDIIALQVQEAVRLIDIFPDLSERQRADILKELVAHTYKLEQADKLSDKTIQLSDADILFAEGDSDLSGEFPMITDLVIGEPGNTQVSGRLTTGDKLSGRSFEGVDYVDANGRPKPNEDRLVVGNNFLAVLDGMGSYGDGDKVSQLIGEYLLKYPNDPETALREAHQEINSLPDSEIQPRAGACMTICYFKTDENGQKIATIYQFGDTKLSVYRANEKHEPFETQDQSFVSFMVQSNQMTPDEALFHPRRNEVMNTMSKGSKFPRIFKTEASLYTGDYLLMASDGLTDNFTFDEIQQLIQEAVVMFYEYKKTEKEYLKSGLITDSLDETTFIQKYLVNAACKRMKNMDDILRKTAAQGGRENLEAFSDGYKSAPKKDNLTVVVVKVE